MCNISLLDDQNFAIKSTYELDTYEHGSFILSCSFTDDCHVYYCVGTSYALPAKDKPIKGRILVFIVEDGELQLTAEKDTEGAVNRLNAINGELLASIKGNIRLYKWVLQDNGLHELQSSVFANHGLDVRTPSIFGYPMMGNSWFINKAVEQDRDFILKLMVAAERLNDNIYLCADKDLHHLTVFKTNDGATYHPASLELTGEYRSAEFVNQFRQGSIPTVFFGTTNGMIGVVASLPRAQYIFLKKLELYMPQVIQSVYGLNHEQWEYFTKKKGFHATQNFLDGDLIQHFLNVDHNTKVTLSKLMGVRVKDLCRRVGDLSRLH